MMTKTAYYMQMAQEAAAQITGSKEQWTAFLTTSARLYKYPFAEQLMIYKQRPEATACAEYDLWNDRMNRYVKRGSKGIALLDMRGEQPKLRYVFDVADTGERKNSRPVQLWKMNAEHEQPIIRALDTAFDVSAGAGSLENHIMEAAERLARDYWEENRRQISDIVADSYLEGYDELNIGASFKRAAAVSIAYSVFTRTVGNADDYFEHEDFLDIFDFNTQAAANVLGTAVSEMSSQIFREIERTIRTYEKDKQAERSQNYDGAELHEERRLPDSGYPVVGAGTEASGQVREDAQSVPAGEQHAAVQSPYPDRETVPAPVGDSGDRDRTDGADDGGSSESESGTGQEIKPDGLGAAHEHAESAGRGSHSDGTYQQLNFMSLFQSEAEQIQKIDAAAENAAKEAESEKPSAFVIVRAKPCLPLWSFSLIRKTELWKTNKPPAMQVSQHCFSLQKKTSGGIINVGSPTALIYTGGIHMDNNSLSHTKWNCKYHIVFAPKYRRKVAYGKIKQDIADILSMLCKRKGVKIVEAEICPDHVHMLVEIPPSISVSYFVGYLKGKSTLMIFERHANLKYKYGNRHFWCRGYYVDTVGKNAKKIQEYIANQLQDDLEYDQMTLKEYIDPFTGEPVKRNK